jgi:hypothetical protein
VFFFNREKYMTTNPLQAQVRAIHSVIVNVLASHEITDHYHTQVPSSEVLTLAVFACLECSGNYTKALRILQQEDIFSRFLHKSRFSRRLIVLIDLVPLVISHLASLSQGRLKQDICYRLERSVFIVDTKPLPFCQNIRIYRCRLVGNRWGKVDPIWRGYTASKRQYFYGFKLNLLTNCLGVPQEYSLHPGSTGDLATLYHLSLDLPWTSEILADKIYNSANIEEYLASQGITLSAIRKDNAKRGREYTGQLRVSMLRKTIETALSMYSELVPRLRVVSLTGAAIKVHLSVLAFSFFQCFRLGIVSY